MSSKWVRIGAMIISIIATVVLNFLPGSAESFEWIGLIATFITSAWCAWKNNDFSFAAKVGTEVMEAIKDGKVTVDEIKEVLNNGKSEQ